MIHDWPRRTWCALCLVLAAASMLLAPGPARAASDAATAEVLMRKSGLWEQLSGVASQVKSGLDAAFEQAATQPPAEEKARLTQLVDRCYSPERLRAATLALLARELQPRHVAALQTWFDGRLGQTISRLEEAASADERELEVQLREGSAMLQEASPARRALLEELTKVTQAAEMMMRLHISGTIAAQQGVASVSPQAQGPSEAELRAALQAQQAQMLQVFGAITLASSAKTYDALPTDDLERYLGFLKSEAGRHFSDASTLAFETAMTAAAGEFGRGLPAPRGSKGS